MCGLNSVFKKCNLYWGFLIVTVILCYGFALTNISIGVDDEGASHIWNGGTGLINNGRFGVLLLSNVFNIMTPLPFWRDFLAVLTLICAATVFVEFFQICSDNNLSVTGQIICACIFVSIPVLAFAFVYLLYVIEFALTLLFAGLALLCFYNGFLTKKIYYYIFCILLLSFGCSFYEHCLNHFITGALCGFLLIVKYDNKSNFKRFALWIALTLALSLTAIFIVFGIAAILRNIVLGTPLILGGYALSAMNINLSVAFLADIALRIKYLAAGSIYYKWYLILSFLFLLTCLIQTIKRKNPLIIIIAVLILLSTFMMEFLQGSGGVPPRTMIVYAVYMGFCGLYIYQSVSKRTLRYAVVFLSVLIVFYNSKEMNIIFYTDYQRYKLDQARSIQIDNEITSITGENIDKPVVFIGRASDYNLPYQYPGEVVGSSVFNWDGYFGIIDNPRIRGFMAMEGKNYMTANEEQIENAKKTAYFMPDWPVEGSVADNGEVIIVRLSSPLYVNYKANEINELLSQYNTSETKITTEGWIIKDDGISLVGQLNEQLIDNENLKVHIVLAGDEDGYIIPTITENQNGGILFLGWTIPYSDIKPQTYQTYLIIEQSGEMYKINANLPLIVG